MSKRLTGVIDLYSAVHGKPLDDIGRIGVVIRWFWIDRTGVGIGIAWLMQEWESELAGVAGIPLIENRTKLQLFEAI